MKTMEYRHVIKLGLVSEKGRRGVFNRAPRCSSLVVVTQRPVVAARPHAAILEICVPSRTDMDLSVLTSQAIPCQRAPRGKPRVTFVSDGNPLRRLLLRSKRNSSLIAVLPGWICPSHREGETAALILADRLVPVHVRFTKSYGFTTTFPNI